uniref:H/ACA ribonucleoprotein complex subunit 2 n=1 Tax=Nothoprocta perdicaria TaxID=30464 RepID=A0A8C7EA67_NOTPE
MEPLRISSTESAQSRWNFCGSGKRDDGEDVSCQEKSMGSAVPEGEQTAKHRQIRRGVKEVQKFINKGEKGIAVLAGDTLPIDVYCHIPIMCEERSLPYAYVPSKSDLGAAAGSKRPTCVILLKPHEEYEEAYGECLQEVEALPLPL